MREINHEASVVRLGGQDAAEVEAQTTNGHILVGMPNLLVLFPDQWRGDALGHPGHPVALTPCTDRALAALRGRLPPRRVAEWARLVA
jgi:hypothetical protein